MNNNNLTSQEAQFLNNKKVQKFIQTKAIAKHNEWLTTNAETTLDRTYALALVVHSAMEWWKTDGKVMAKSMNIEWSQEEFAYKCMGINKSYMYELVKVAKVDSTIVEDFKRVAKRERAIGNKPDMTYRSLLTYATKRAQDEKGEVKIDLIQPKKVATKVAESKQSIADVPTLHIPHSTIVESPTTTNPVSLTPLEEAKVDSLVAEGNEMFAHLIAENVDVIIDKDGNIQGKYNADDLFYVIERLFTCAVSNGLMQQALGK